MIIFSTGLPMSLSSTSNSLKSSGTFNSNSSINSTPSVDRYAALKDLDEQLREIKENHNQNTLTAAAPVNPFNIISSSSSPSAQPNPFQTQSSPLWFGEQQGLTTPTQPMYSMTNGTTNGNGNGFHDQSAFGMNGSAFNGNGQHYPKVTDTHLFNGSNGLNMTNGFPQKNPFAVRTIFLSLSHAHFHLTHFLNKKSFFFFFATGSSIKCNNKSVSMNLVNRSETVKTITSKTKLYFNRFFEQFALNVNRREEKKTTIQCCLNKIILSLILMQI